MDCSDRVATAEGVLAPRHDAAPRSADGDLVSGTGAAHEELGNDDEAGRACEYVERFPGDTYGYWGLAEYHLRQGEHDEARGQLERAVLLDPLLVDHAIELAGINLDVGRFDEAEAGLGRALELSRTWWDSAGVLRGRGRYHQRRGEMADAIRAIEARQELQSRNRSPTGMAIGELEDIPTYP